MRCEKNNKTNKQTKEGGNIPHFLIYSFVRLIITFFVHLLLAKDDKALLLSLWMRTPTLWC